MRKPTVMPLRPRISAPNGRPHTWWSRSLLGVYALVLLVCALALPAIPQAVHYHAFADDRTLWGLPYAMDVLSNLPFMLAAMAIAWGLHRVTPTQLHAYGQRHFPLWWWLSALAALGFALTAIGSSYYHLHPVDAGVVWDRLAMSFIFAAIIGLAVQQVADDGVASAMTLFTLVSAVLALAVWWHSGNFTPWVVVQAGGMGLLLAIACLQKTQHQRTDVPFLSLAAIVIWYALAKAGEWGDHAVFHATAGHLSGHSLKHLLAALAAWPLVQMLYNAHTGAGKLAPHPVQ